MMRTLTLHSRLFTLCFTFGLLVISFTHLFADNYDEDCPLCTEWDESSGDCIPITTPDYTIPVEFCDHPINYVVYNPSFEAGGYILPNPPLRPPQNLFVTNRCHNGIMEYRIEGKFDLYSFTINVVDSFLITSPNCNWPVNTERPRNPGFIDKSRIHERTHCTTLTTAINLNNRRVIDAGWFLSRVEANRKRLEIINEGNQTWTTALQWVLSNRDVAGQIKTVVEGKCYIERQIGTYVF